MVCLVLLFTGFMLTDCSKQSDVELRHSEQNEKVDIYIDGQPFSSYAYAEKYKKPILYPVRTARGTIITREFLNRPLGQRSDHPHQVGFWFTYGNVNGIKFWQTSTAHPPPERYDEFGAVYHREIKEKLVHRGNGRLTVTKDWITLDNIPLLEEETTYVFFGEDSKRGIDRITKLRALDQDVSFDDDKEGVLGIRLIRELNLPGPNDSDDVTGWYRSSEGVEGIGVWGTRARCVKLSGRVDRENISVVLMDHPDNVGYPTYWHARGNGLFAANPFGQADFTEGRERLNFALPAGESVTFKHRMLIFSDVDTTDDLLNREWERFAR